MSAPDGRTLTVYYWSGVDTCYGLADVLVSDVGGVVTIELQVGTLPGVDMCIEMAQLYKTIVLLDAPGARRRRSATGPRQARGAGAGIRPRARRPG